MNTDEKACPQERHRTVRSAGRARASVFSSNPCSSVSIRGSPLNCYHSAPCPFEPILAAHARLAAGEQEVTLPLAEHVSSLRVAALTCIDPESSNGS